MLQTFDSLMDREAAMLASLVKPSEPQITREQYRAELEAGRFDGDTFLENLAVVRAMAPRAWGLPRGSGGWSE